MQQIPPAPPVRITPVVIGIIMTVMLLFGLAYISKLRRNAVSTAPALTIISPGAAAPADSPLVVRFTSTVPIVLRSSGWGATSYHLHAHVNSVEYMPAAADITFHAGAYSWTIPGARRGPLSIRLGWADLQHRAVVSGATATVHTTLR